MTIGEKIKLFRKSQNITQAKLASLTGIHFVSIAKYETNKMVPQPVQIEKIADALGINTYALTGIKPLKFETAGNIMSVMLLLLNAGVIDVNWETWGNGRPNVSSAKITLNPVFSSFLAVGSATQDSNADVNQLFLKFTKSNMFGDFIMYCGLKKMLEESAAEGKNAENDVHYLSTFELLQSTEKFLQTDHELLETVLRNDWEIHEQEKDAMIASAKECFE